MKITIIGYGNLGKAIAQGLREDAVTLSSPSLSSGKTAEGFITTADNQQAVLDAEIVILAVKPNKIEAVCREIASNLSSSALVISMATGINLEQLQKALPPNQPIVRSMPNIGASMGISATPLIGTKTLTPQHKALAETVFQRLGVLHWVDKEDEMNVFTALSGSGPAYFFLFMEAMVSAAKARGLDPEVAKHFTVMTAKAAVQLADQSSLSLHALREKVTAPQGTTAAALSVFQSHQFEDLVAEAMQAAYNRAKELEGGR